MRGCPRWVDERVFSYAEVTQRENTQRSVETRSCSRERGKQRKASRSVRTNAYFHTRRSHAERTRSDAPPISREKKHPRASWHGGARRDLWGLGVTRIAVIRRKTDFIAVAISSAKGRFHPPQVDFIACRKTRHCYAHRVGAYRLCKRWGEGSADLLARTRYWLCAASARYLALRGGGKSDG